MSDSRISQAVAEVSAAVELLNNARNTMHELLEEDPAFTGAVRMGLLAAGRELFRADITATNALSALRTADACENRTVAS
jgi:hypothetical protein